MQGHFRPFSAIWGAAFALAGCVVGPRYAPPSDSLASAFVHAPDHGQVPRTAVDDNQTWWRTFDDPELALLVDRALTQNLDLAQAEARLSQARARAAEAGAARLPEGQAYAQGQFQRQSLNSPLGEIGHPFPGYDRNQSLYDLGASASWELDLFGGLKRGAQAARAQYEASDAARAGVRLSVAAAVADAYIKVRALQARLAVAKAQSATQARLVDLTQLQFSRGVAAQLQLDQARGAAAAVDASVPVLQAALEAELDALEVLVGVMPGTLRAELATPAPLPSPPRLSAAGGPAALVRRRPDIIAAERSLAAADAQIGVAVADYYPKVTISGLVGFESGSTSSLFTGGSFQPQGLVGLRWRLFDFGRVDAEVAAAKGGRAEALAAYRQSVLRATGEVEASLVALEQRQVQAMVLDQGERSLARASEEAKLAYDAGHVSLIEVLYADQSLLFARDQKVQAQAEAARAAISAFKALGGGWTA